MEHHSPAAASIDFLPLTCLSAFIFFFSVGFGPVPWLMMGELFSQEAKEKASAVSGEEGNLYPSFIGTLINDSFVPTASFNWGTAFLVTQCYGTLASEIGSAVTFWGFAFFSVAVLIFCVIRVPETRGRSLEEIQVRMRGKN